MNETKDWTSVSFEEARSVLRQWREEHVRRSEETVEMWEHILSRHPRSLGDELWLIYEQKSSKANKYLYEIIGRVFLIVKFRKPMLSLEIDASVLLPVCIAALDCARLELAIECIQALHKKFPRSNRVFKLQAMRFEAIGRYTDALRMYDQLIEADPTNMSYRKRKVAVLIAQGNKQEAIRELTEYLKTFLNDNEAWLELSQLYLTEGDYARAAHCIEELLLSNPHNSLYLRRLAEIRYTQGGQENLEIAKAYYDHAIRTNPLCNRSLFGMLLCCHHLAQKSAGQRKREFINAGTCAADRLIQRYKEADLEGINPNIKSQIDVVQRLKSQL